MNGHSDEAIRATTPQTDEEWLSAMQDAADDEREAEWQEAHGDDLPTWPDLRYWPDAESRSAAREWLLSPGMVAAKTTELGITADEWRGLVALSNNQRDEDASGYSDTVRDGLERWTR